MGRRQQPRQLMAYRIQGFIEMSAFLVLICSVQTCCADFNSATFYQVTTNPSTYNSGQQSPENVRWTSAVSHTQCCQFCLQAETSNNMSCTTILYNTTTRLCGISLTPADLATQVEAGLGSISSMCDLDLGYRVYFSNKTLACLTGGHPHLNYTNARKACGEIGGFLASVKTLDKLLLIDEQIPGGKWLGLNDMEQEGVWVWEEDGTIAFAKDDGLTPAQTAARDMSGMWMIYEPANHYYDTGIPENCAESKSIFRYTYKMQDLYCAVPTGYVCEMKMLI